MKKFVLAFWALALPAFAQNQGPFTVNGPVGQSVGGIVPDTFTQNTPPVGFTEFAFTSITAAGATQGTSTVIPARTVIITSCTTGQGVELPSVQHYTPVLVINRSGASCLVYPSPGATVETALGTDGATNAANTQATNTDVTYKSVSPTRWVQ